MKNNFTQLNKILSVLFLFILGTIGVMAETSTTPTTDELTHKITLTVTSGVPITLNLAVTNIALPIWIDLDGSGTYTSRTIAWSQQDLVITPTGTTVVVLTTNLTDFKCANAGANLTAIKLENTPTISSVNFSGSNVASFYAENAVKLTSVQVNSTTLADFTLINTGLSYIPTSSALSVLYVENNKNMTNLSIGSRPNLSTATVKNNLNLRQMYASNCGSLFTTLVVEGNTAMTQLMSTNNGLTSCTITGNTLLSSVDVSQNALTTLNLSSNPAITYLKADYNKLTSLTPNTAIENIYCQNNAFTTLSLNAGYTALKKLDCRSNSSLTSLNVNGASSLTELYSGWSSLTYLNIGATALTALYFNATAVNLATLITADANQLTTINCRNSALTGLDLSDNPAFTTLYCDNSDDLTSLNLANGNTALIKTMRVEDSPLLTCIQVDPGFVLSNKGTNWRYDNIATLNNTSVPCAITVADAPDAGAPYITMTVTPSSVISFSAAAPTNQSPIWVSLDGGTTYQSFVIGTGTASELHSVTSTGPSVIVYGAMTSFDCSDNTSKLTGLVATTHPTLTSLTCNNSALTALDVSGMTALTSLDCFTNNSLLTSLTADNTGLHSIAEINDELTTLSLNDNANLTGIYVNSKHLTSLSAKNNPKMTEVYCSNNDLTVLNLSDNVLLSTLECQENSLPTVVTSDASDLTGLNLTGDKTSLKSLNLQYNSFTDIDLSGFTNLSALDCRNNSALTSVNVNGNTALTSFYCSNPGLQTLEATNTAFTTLDVSSCSLTTLDLSGNTSLTSLNCQGNALTALDMSSNTALTELDCSSNALTSLSVRNGNNANFAQNSYDHAFDARYNSALSCILVDETFDPTTVVPTTSWIKDSWARWNNTANTCDIFLNDPPSGANSIDLTVTTNAEISFTAKVATAGTPIWINNNGTTTYHLITSTSETFSVTASGTSLIVYGDITGFDCSGEKDNLDVITLNEVTNISTSNTEVLTELYCDFTEISALNLSNDTHLTKVSCLNTPALLTLDVSGCTSLATLYCDNVNTTSINVSSTLLPSFYYGNGKLEVLTATDMTQMQWVSCQNNNLSTLTLTGSTALKTLYCFGNVLTSLDISTLTALEELSASINSITALNTAYNTALTTLDIERNQLTALDVSLNTNLTYLSCHSNKLTSLNVRNGNNANFVANSEGVKFNAHDNPDLKCIRIDPLPFTLDETSWQKDIEATWNNTETSCEDYIIPEGTSYIEMTVPSSSSVTFTVQTGTGSTPVWIKTGNSTTYELLTADKIYTITSTGDNIQVYGAITGFTCSGDDTTPSPITGLNTSHNTELTTVECNYTNVTSVDFGNALLMTLDCSNNALLTTLDASACPALTSFICSDNVTLTGLSIANGNNTNLLLFTATGNTDLTCIDVDLALDLLSSPVTKWSYDTGTSLNNTATPCSDIPTLETATTQYIDMTVTAGNTYHFEIGVGDGAVSIWIVTTEGTAFYNVLSSSRTFDINTAGTNIKVYGAVTSFNCSGSSTAVQSITALDVSHNTSLMKLECEYTQLTSLTLPATPLVTELISSNNASLTALNVSANTTLTSVECEYTAIPSLTVTGHATLTRLACSNNASLTTLDVSDNPALTDLSCDNPVMTSLTMSNIGVTSFHFGNGVLTTLVAKNNTALTSFACQGNALTSLDVSGNTALTNLICYDNKLVSFTLTGCTALVNLECSSNELTTIDFSGLTALESLDIDHNKLGTLDVSGNTNLRFLCVCTSELTSLNVANGHNTDFVIGVDGYKCSAVNNPNLKCIQVDEDFDPSADPAWLKHENTIWNNSGTSCDSYLTAAPTDQPSIALTVGSSSSIGFTVEVAQSYTPIWIVRTDGTNTPVVEYHLMTTTTETFTNTDPGTSIEIYGDITAFNASGTAGNLNDITALDASLASELHTLTLNYTNASSITGLTGLTNLTCTHNSALVSIDVSGDTGLESLDCSSNGLTSLDLESNVALVTLHAQNNALTTLSVRNGHNDILASMNTTGNSELSCILIDENYSPVLPANAWTKDLYSLYNNTAVACSTFIKSPSDLTTLITLGVTDGTDISFDISADYDNCRIWYTMDNGTTYISQTITQALSTLTITPTSSGEIKLYGQIANFECKGSATSSAVLNTLTVSENHPIQHIVCEYTTLTTLTSKNTDLRSITCDYNSALISVDVSENSLLTDVYCNMNSSLTSLILTNDILLESLNAQTNALASLNLSTTTALSSLLCYNNQFTALDLSTTTALTSLLCYNNELTALDLSNNLALITLDCSENQITALDVAVNTALTSLSCEKNALTSLFIRNGENDLITTFDSHSNPDLTCIEIDLIEDLATVPSSWTKDAIASWNQTPVPCSTPYISMGVVDGSSISMTLKGVTGEDTPIWIENPAGTFTAYTIPSGSTLALSSLLADGEEMIIHGFVTTLDCNGNGSNVISLDLSNNVGLTGLDCSSNDITALDLEFNTALTTLDCSSTLIEELNVVLNTALTSLTATDCDNLRDVNLRNGNNTSLTTLDLQNNTALSCIAVDENLTIPGAWTKDDDADWNTSSRPCVGVITITAVEGSTITVSGYDQIGSTVWVEINGTVTEFLVDEAAVGAGHDFTATGGTIIIYGDLTSFDCSGNGTNLTGLSVNDVSTLTSLDCSDNALTVLEGSNNPNISNLYCSNNTLTNLDVSNLPLLEVLNCSQNDITYVDGTSGLTLGEANTVLHTIDCSYNPSMGTLDVSPATTLSRLYCDGNGLTSLILTDGTNENTSFDFLECQDNLLTSVDLSKVPNLAYLLCHNNLLTDLDLTLNTNLLTLDCSYNSTLTSLNLNSNVNLISVDCRYNGLNTLSIRNGFNSNLSTFYSKFNINLTCILIDLDFDITTHSTLTWDQDDVSIYNNTATACSTPTDQPTIVLTVPANSSVELTLKAASTCTSAWIKLNNDVNGDVSGEYYTELSLSPSPTDFVATTSATTITIYGAVTYLNVSNNGDQITAIDASGNTGLERLYCDNNSLTTLLLKDAESDPAVPALEVLSCDFNALTTLDVSACTALTYLSCRSNELSTLSLSANTALTKLHVDANKLTTLSLTGLVNIEELTCSFNQLTSLDASGVSALRRINCSYNLLTTLNVRNTHNADFTKSYQIMAFDAAHNTSSLAITVDVDFTAPTTGDHAWIFDRYSTLTWISL